MAAAPLAAVPDEPERAYDLPAGDAATTLRLFSEVSGREILFAADAIRGVQTQAVQGRFTAFAALTRMLDGTPLFAWQDSHTGALAVRRRAGAAPRTPGATSPDEHPPNLSDSSMKPKPFWAAIGAWFASTALSAPVIPANTSAEESVVLSPFVVSSEHDTGYAATDSLAGTRLRTDLRDIAASVTVVTKDLLDDLGATDLESLLVYTTGTEVAGVGGNYSNSISQPAFQNYEPERDSVNSGTRVRGLAAADQTRNFFATRIPLDAYNTQSVTINRGANAILFGFGSPAGIIENSLEQAQLNRNSGQVQFRAGSYGSNRASLDVNQVVWKSRLAVRVAGLDEHRKFEQNFAFADQRRVFAALTFKPFAQTTLRLNGERGQLSQRKPRLDPPVDSISSWWQFGKPVRETTIFSPNSVVNAQKALNLNGLAGQWDDSPGLMYYTVNTGQPDDARVANSSGGGTTYAHRGPRDSKGVGQNVLVPADPLAGFSVARQIVDRSIYDYRQELIEGPNGGLWMNFKAFNAALEQLLWGGQAGFELVYDYQGTDQDVLRPVQAFRGNNIFIDVDRLTIDGRPNPNFGRPYISAAGTATRTKNRDETARATAFVRHDFRRQAGWLGRVLGTQTLTGMATQSTSTQDFISGVNAAADPAWRSGANASSLGARRIATVVYLGPSLANASSPAGAGLRGVSTPLPVPSSVKVWNRNATTNFNWVQQDVPLHAFPDFQWLAGTVTAGKDKVKSYSTVLQSEWLDKLLVSTAGWRSDEVEGFTGDATAINPQTGTLYLNRPELVRNLSVKSSTFSYGVALHAPEKALRRLPGRPDLSLYYNESENFQLNGARQNAVGDPLSPPSGRTKEIGFGLRALDNRVSFRATWYETVQENVTDERFSTAALARVVELETDIARNIPEATLRAAGFAAPDGAQASTLFKRYLSHYNFRLGALRADGTRDAQYEQPPDTYEVTTSVSKGLELEAVFNPTSQWRILLNAARQRATRGDTGATFGALVAERLPQWQIPVVWAEQIGSPTVESFTTSQIVNPLNTARLSTGEKTPELREWRANLVTNYTFPRDSALKGWAIGAAVRWQDAMALGTPVIDDPVLGLVTDVKHPFMGAEEVKYDGWLSYRRKLWRNVNWKLQLNVRNLFNTDLLVPVHVTATAVGDLKHYTVDAYRIGAARTWELTSTFSF